MVTASLEASDEGCFICVFGNSVDGGVDGEVVKFVADTGTVNWLEQYQMPG